MILPEAKVPDEIVKRLETEKYASCFFPDRLGLLRPAIFSRTHTKRKNGYEGPQYAVVWPLFDEPKDVPVKRKHYSSNRIRWTRDSHCIHIDLESQMLDAANQINNDDSIPAIIADTVPPRLELYEMKFIHQVSQKLNPNSEQTQRLKNIKQRKALRKAEIQNLNSIL